MKFEVIEQPSGHWKRKFDDDSAESAIDRAIRIARRDDFYLWWGGDSGVVETITLVAYDENGNEAARRRNITAKEIKTDPKKKVRKILNLTQHYATSDQIAAGVFDASPEDKVVIRYLQTFTELPDSAEVKRRAEELATLATKYMTKRKHVPRGADWYAMIGGEPYMIIALDDQLCRKSITPVYNFSIRKRVGGVETTNHVGFVEVYIDMDCPC